MSIIPPSRRLVLVRHGESQANADGLFTGKLDPPLTENGRREAWAVGTTLGNEGHCFEAAFTSTMTRAVTTMSLALGALGQEELVPCRDAALDERDYGDLGGLDKATSHKRFGAAQVEDWRRSHEGRPPNGESLRDTAARVLPFHLRRIQPATMRGPTLVVGHGNALPAMVMALEGLGPGDVECLELATGSIRIYEFAPDTTIASRRIIG